MRSAYLAWTLVLGLSWGGLPSASAQPQEGDQSQPGAAPAAGGETAAVGKSEAEPEAKPKAKAKKRAKTKKETAEERYRRSKYFAIIPAEPSTYRFKAEGDSSGKPSKSKGKKGKKASPPGAKKCDPSGGASCSPGDGCECCQAKIDCEELEGCQWRPQTEGDEKLEVGAGQCVGKAAAARVDDGS